MTLAERFEEIGEARGKKIGEARGEARGKKIGEARGKVLGAEQEKRAVILKMLDKDIDIHTVSEVVDLPIETIKEVQAENDKVFTD